MSYVAGVNPVDYKIRKGEMMKFIISKPKIPGGDLSGVVENAPAESKVILPKFVYMQPQSLLTCSASFLVVYSLEKE